MPDARVDAGRVDLHQHVVLADRRSIDVPELQHVGRAVFVLDDCLHHGRLLKRPARRTSSRGSAYTVLTVMSWPKPLKSSGFRV